MTIEITVSKSPSESDREAILRLLVGYNDQFISSADYERVALMLRETPEAEPIGGLYGEIYYKHLFVNLLFVPESLRGQGVGSRLLTQAEEMARGKGCDGVWLDSFSFQAPGFYLKHGYREFGTIPDFPPGFRRHFFCKRLDGAAPSL